jgi:hypothetical protein
VARVRDVLASPAEARPGEARPAASSGETAASGGRRERLDLLAAMGFASEAANAAALDACGDDLDTAVARLLDAADDDDARGETGGGSQSQGGTMDAMADASDADLARAIRLSLADRSGDARRGRG